MDPGLHSLAQAKRLQAQRPTAPVPKVWSSYQRVGKGATIAAFFKQCKP